jgi:hypothetical protein
VYASVNPLPTGSVIDVADAFPLYVAVPFVRVIVNPAAELFWNIQNAPEVIPVIDAGNVIPVMPVVVM